MSGLSSIAEVSSRIEKIFLTKAINEAGCYAVALTINGEMRTVVVDDRFPYDTKNKTWGFSRQEIPGKKKEIWVLVLEKAWAKVFGSY